MYKCRHFKIHELVPPAIFKKWGEKAWQFLDENALRQLDLLRDVYGSMTINNYYWGGDRQWSGLRTPDSPYYSVTSQHTYGKAFDIIFKKISAEEVRSDILENHDHVNYSYIMSFEAGVSWLHFDTRNCNRIKIYKP